MSKFIDSEAYWSIILDLCTDQSCGMHVDVAVKNTSGNVKFLTLFCHRHAIVSAIFVVIDAG